jgi:hypothetical protein
LFAGQGLSLDPSRCVKNAAYTMIVQASLDATEGWRRILFSKGWGDKYVSYLIFIFSRYNGLIGNL